MLYIPKKHDAEQHTPTEWNQSPTLPSESSNISSGHLSAVLLSRRRNSPQPYSSTPMKERTTTLPIYYHLVVIKPHIRNTTTESTQGTDTIAASLLSTPATQLVYRVYTNLAATTPKVLSKTCHPFPRRDLLPQDNTTRHPHTPCLRSHNRTTTTTTPSRPIPSYLPVKQPKSPPIQEP